MTDEPVDLLSKMNRLIHKVMDERDEARAEVHDRDAYWRSAVKRAGETGTISPLSAEMILGSVPRPMFAAEMREDV